jgi:hypothetical protein
MRSEGKNKTRVNKQQGKLWKDKSGQQTRHETRKETRKENVRANKTRQEKTNKLRDK